MSRSTHVWHTSISMLLFNFREALVAILPYVDAVKIGWRDHEAYDDWDEISSSLYRNMVEKSILHSIECRQDLKVPPYDLLIPSYCGYLHIAVIFPQYSNLAFIGFSTQNDPFDSVKCVSIRDGQVIHDEILYLPLKECEFAAVYESASIAMSITDITLEI